MEKLIRCDECDGQGHYFTKKSKMKIEISYDDKEGVLHKMRAFSEWFTQNQIIPNLNERVFVPDDSKIFIDESAISGSGEWIVTSKYFCPEANCIRIWMKDIKDTMEQ